MTYKGTVIKQVGGKFTVKTKEKTFTISARGKLRQNGLFVGDIVETDGIVVNKVYPRKNSLIRPSICNIDQIIIVIAPVPITDFSLIDKLIIYADINNIDTVICVNKADTDNSLYERIKYEYSNIVSNIVKTSGLNKDINELKPLLKGKISVFAGQSAVGKSTLLNAIFDKEIALIGELSKIEKGKNTTRETEIFEIDENSYIADTPGFSMLSLINFSPNQVSQGYKEFYQMSPLCKYKQCDHIFVTKDDCKVLRELENNDKIKERYERYKALYIETNENWRKRYE